MSQTLGPKRIGFWVWMIAVLGGKVRIAWQVKRQVVKPVDLRGKPRKPMIKPPSLLSEYPCQGLWQGRKMLHVRDTRDEDMAHRKPILEETGQLLLLLRKSSL